MGYDAACTDITDVLVLHPDLCCLIVLKSVPWYPENQGTVGGALHGSRVAGNASWNELLLKCR